MKNNNGNETHENRYNNRIDDNGSNKNNNNSNNANNAIGSLSSAEVCQFMDALSGNRDPGEAADRNNIDPRRMAQWTVARLLTDIFEVWPKSPDFEMVIDPSLMAHLKNGDLDITSIEFDITTSETQNT